MSRSGSETSDRSSGALILLNVPIHIGVSVAPSSVNRYDKRGIVAVIPAHFASGSLFIFFLQNEESFDEGGTG